MIIAQFVPPRHAGGGGGVGGAVVRASHRPPFHSSLRSIMPPDGLL